MSTIILNDYVGFLFQRLKDLPQNINRKAGKSNGRYSAITNIIFLKFTVLDYFLRERLFA